MLCYASWALRVFNYCTVRNHVFKRNKHFLTSCTQFVCMGSTGCFKANYRQQSDGQGGSLIFCSLRSLLALAEALRVAS